jgi:hypothetical protein
MIEWMNEWVSESRDLWGKDWNYSSVSQSLDGSSPRWMEVEGKLLTFSISLFKSRQEETRQVGFFEAFTGGEMSKLR